MRSFIQLLREKFLPSHRSQERSKPRFIRPRLEALEDRLVLDAYTFTGAGDGVSWFDANNWLNTSNPAIISVPGAVDSASIGPGFNVAVSGGSAVVNSVSVTGSSLTVSSSLESNLMTTAAGAPLTVNPGGEVKIDSSAMFSGAVTDTGLINANTTNPFTGTTITFAGGAEIGPGDLNGNLAAGPNSNINFTDCWKIN